MLRTAGWDAVHVGEIGMAMASDAEILRKAVEGERMVITLDADFHRLLAVSGALMPSVVRVREEGLTAAPLVKLLLDAVAHSAQSLEAGAAVTVTGKKVRIRSLPIKSSRA